MFKAFHVGQERIWDACLFKCNSIIHDDYNKNLLTAETGYFVSVEAINRINYTFKQYGFDNPTLYESFITRVNMQSKCKPLEYHIINNSLMTSIGWIYMKNMGDKQL